MSARPAAAVLALCCAGCVREEPHPVNAAGILALDAGDATGALSHFDTALAELPTEARVALNRGVALERLKRHDEAAAAFTEALALDDSTRAARIRYDLGTAKARAGRSKDALADYRIALRLDPLDEQTRHNLELILQARAADAARAKIGMSDQLSLGKGLEGGPDRVVLRARIAPDPLELKLARYWVGHVFDRFDGRRWTNTGVDLEPQPKVVLGPSSPTEELQEIQLLPGWSSSTLVGLERPVLFGNVRSAAGPLDLIERSGDEVRLASTRDAVRYEVVSGTTAADAGVAPLGEASRWLGLPPELDPRVATLTALVVGAERDPVAAGAKLVTFLRRDYRYTLAGGDPWATDPLAEFLFVRRAGHCEEFATAVAVMLRTQGFPTRAVGGFSGGDRVGSHYELRCSQAHAWAQVFSPARGWVTLDATPEGDGRRDVVTRKSQPLTKREANALIDRVDDPTRRILRWGNQDGPGEDGGVQDW